MTLVLGSCLEQTVNDVNLKTAIRQNNVLLSRLLMSTQDALTRFATTIAAVLLAVLIMPDASRAEVVGADALVIVNSDSARYLDFRNNIQPYLDNFGVPYSVLDLKTNAVTTDIEQHALIIIGHREIDPNHDHFDTSAQNILSLSVSNGTGLVNFDGALSSDGVSPTYIFVQEIFGFTYSSDTVSSENITFPATESGSQLHYVTALHSTADSISIRSNLVLADVTFPTKVTALVQRGADPLLMVTTHGQGRAVQWGGYDWMTMAVKGPMAGLDDLVWRSLIWAARKPFVLRGMPNHVVLRVDDVAGPKLGTSSSTALTNWVRVATETGFKPHLELFFNCLDQGEIKGIRSAVTNGQATASIHSQGCGGGSFFFFDHASKQGWPDDVVAQNFETGTQWLLDNGIPHAKTMCPHYSEVGTNIFAGLKAWGVEFTSIEVVPGQVEYTTPGAPWLVAGPYRLYETPLEGQSIYPFFYADFLPIPNHPELNGQFFNCYTEIRDASPCAEWCPDNNVANSVAMGVRQLKRGFDSMAMATLYTHDYYFYPTDDQDSMAGTGPITVNNWRSILQGITNGIASYNPKYVTIDYACQYVRATRTAQLTNATYNPTTREIQMGLGGHSDLQLQVQVFVEERANAISNYNVFVNAFTNSISIGSSSNQPPPVIVPETTKPTIVITSPIARQRWSNEVLSVIGTSKDNVGVTNVACQLNGSGWLPAQTLNGWTNWTADMLLSPGSNFLQAFATDSSGGNSTTNSVSFTCVLTAPLTVQTNGNGTLTPNLSGQVLEIGKTYMLTAKPAVRYLFAGWSGSVSSFNPVLNFLMQSNLTVQANFVTNPFVGLKGKFYGLFSETNDVRNHDHSGAFDLTLAEAGTYSASFQLGSKKLPAKGAFDWLGQSVLKLKPSLTETVTVALQLDVTNLNAWVSGTASNGVWTSPLLGYRATVYPADSPSPLAGKYTLVIPGSDDAAASPGGDGYGTVTVSKAGSLKLAGKLADGTTLSQSVPVSADGWWTLYSSLYSSKGSLHGWMMFTNETISDISGGLSWIKPALAASKYYPLGFTNKHEAAGSLYVSPTTNRVVNLTNGTVEFLHGNLIQPITNDVLLTANNKITNLSSNKLTMTFTLTSGLVKGSVTDNNTDKAIPFTGVLFQKLDSGYGFFPGTNQSGQLRFIEAP